MVLLLNTSEPIMILIYTLIIAGVVFVAKETKNAGIMFLVLAAVVFFLINHSLMLDSLNLTYQAERIKEVYHCIGMDLVFLFLTFISYLWVDDLSAKKHNKKSYDDSLSWFWEKL